MAKLMQDVIIRPIVTENSMAGAANKKYTFEVAKDSTKPQIKQAVEGLFGVEVEKVNVLNVRGRFKRVRREPGRTSAWKKAIVTLKAGSKGIDFFEGMM